jgi:enolase-phosphatase E1
MRSAAAPTGSRIRSILLDIEGTTTPVDFVYKVLFPYARIHVEDFIRRNWHSESLRADLQRLSEEHAEDLRQNREPPPWREESMELTVNSIVAYVHWLIDRDRKSTGLKSLQGKIWQAGYEKGELRGEVFPDVPSAFARWRGQERTICIFSSGSVLAQKLLFSNSSAGDLTPFIWKYFDTTTGPKAEPDSYRQIAAACALSPEEILFISDVAGELDAAQSAGFKTVLCVRPGMAEPAGGSRQMIQSFHQIFADS